MRQQRPVLGRDDGDSTIRPGAGTLYRLERTNGDDAVTAIFSGITVANGLDWSPDNRLMYYIDSPTQRIDVFDFDEESGALANRRAFVEIPVADGMPDGMTVDAEGHVWVALFRGAKVRRYRPDAGIDLEVNVPVTLVTSCAFGGPHCRGSLHHDGAAPSHPRRSGRADDGGRRLRLPAGSGREAAVPLRMRAWRRFSSPCRHRHQTPVRHRKGRA